MDADHAANIDIAKPRHALKYRVSHALNTWREDAGCVIRRHTCVKQKKLEYQRSQV